MSHRPCVPVVGRRYRPLQQAHLRAVTLVSIRQLKDNPAIYNVTMKVEVDDGSPPYTVHLATTYALWDRNFVLLEESDV
jgi:hypothetical protein